MNPGILQQRLQDVCRADYFRLKRQLKQADRKGKESLLQVAREIDVAIQKKQLMQANHPSPRFDTSLPINDAGDEIRKTLQQNQVVIICGETGSGKTTQLPLYCLDIGRGIEGVIGHSQPRRIAARTVAKRIADELQTKLGEQVGFKIRHQDLASDDTYIKLMTDGILLNEMQHDRYLNRYDTLIIDEAHERSLNIDFILGYLKQLLPKRPDLKVIVTSATIDVERFSRYFDNAPVIEVSGKTYPVDVLYRPIDDDNDEHEADRLQAILDAILELATFDMGDILVFLEGEGEIHETDRFLRKQQLRDTDILPLYSRLSSSRQSRIFAPHKRRHVVLATNVAETSLTIPGIRYVIDTGMARISRYSARSKVQRLPIEKVSRAAANQRKGRCGRTSDGICIRLYSEADYEARAEFTQPEILRTNLASVILQMKSLGLGEIKDYPFLEPPDDKLVNDGINVLKEINALDTKGELTRIGRRLVRMPIEPRYARMLIAANDYQCVSEMLVIVSALSIQDPRERPLENTEKADKAHAKFADEDSDFLWYMNLWQFYHKQMQKLSQNKLKKLCDQNFLSYMRMREWLDIHRQLRHICTDLKYPLNREPAGYEKIHCAILTGLPGQVAFLSGKHEYSGARNTTSYLFPASCLFEKKPKWVVAAELIETSRLFARTVAKIEPQWVIKTARHLLKYSYADMHWEQETQRVVALETTSLYGITLRAQRKINYGKVNPKEARGLFIRHALVDSEFSSHARFLEHNYKLMNDIREAETRTRRPDMLDEEAVFDFYNRHIPADVFDGHSFERWASKLNEEQVTALCLQREAILLEDNSLDLQQYYPDTLQANRIALPVEYCFSPGSQGDGINVDIPLELLNQFKREEFDYLVPGLLEEKITFLFKSLPKPIRKQLVPVPDVASECIQTMKRHSGSLRDNLAAWLFRTRGIRVQEQDWSEDNLPDHLKVNYRVFDKHNKQLAESRDLETLQEELSGQTDSAFQAAVTRSTDDQPIDKWDFADIPVSEQIESGSSVLTVYPSLLDEAGKVYRHAFDSLESAEYHLRFGLRALVKQMLSSEIKYLRKHLRDIEKLALLYSTLGTKEDLVESIVNQVVDDTFLYEGKPVRKQARFLALLEHGKQRMLLNAEKLCSLLSVLLTEHRNIRAELESSRLVNHSHAIDDITDQLDYLVYNGFIEDVAMNHLSRYPQYFEAIHKRLEKLQHSPGKDEKNTDLIAEHWNRIKQLVDNAYETGDYPALLDEYRWMMEEWRISLFAQEIKTRMPVSIKRMDKKWDALKQLTR